MTRKTGMELHPVSPKTRNRGTTSSPKCSEVAAGLLIGFVHVLVDMALRIMGAGERMARAVEAGGTRPTLITLVIATVLFVWALYAFAGAGVIGQLPFTNLALPAISLVYLARGLGFPLLRPMWDIPTIR